MIKEFELYHGAVLSRLIHCAPRAVAVRTYPSPSNASYIIDERIGLYIKHSTKRLSPWTFTFQGRHQAEIRDMYKLLGDVCIVFVCHTDGVVSLRFAELQTIISIQHATAQWVRISRRHRERYSIVGRRDRLRSKIGDSEFPRNIFERQNTEYATSGVTF